MLLIDYKTNTLLITPIQLRKALGWETNIMLKKHLKTLKDLNYITYQDALDDSTLKPNQLLEVKISNVNSDFTELTEKSIKENILVITTNRESLVRLCYLIKCYTNSDYGYCWLTYEQISEYGSIRKNDMNKLTTVLSDNEILSIDRGKNIVDKLGKIRRENNKYRLLIN
jgi:hypothetical protein